MCCRSASTKPILPRKETKTATPPNRVTARCVSRRINRSSDNSAVISRGTGLSVAFDSIPLLSQIVRSKIILIFVFQAEHFVTLGHAQLELLKLNGLRPGAHVLEIGCGSLRAGR